jgi:hypothetical protein
MVRLDRGQKPCYVRYTLFRPLIAVMCCCYIKQVPAVVDETIIGGKVIPELLRAAVNVSTGQGKGFYDW